MSDKNNVIDFTQRRQAKQRQPKSQNETVSGAKATVTDMTERRMEIIKQERREVRRTILTEFVGAFVVVPRQGLAKVSLYDISENGIAFDMDIKAGQFKTGEEVAMRVYLNQQTYFPFIVKVQNVRREVDEGVFRHGANFVKDTINDKALHHFVKFIESVSASLEKDTGDVMVSNLGQ
jgi:hypothetical protein